MAGFGTGPYGLAPLGFPTDDPISLVPAKIGSARSLDVKTRRYIVADDGGFEAMDETAQRVVLVVAFALANLPAFITPQGEAEIEQRIRDGLAAAQMIDTRDPDIDLEAVDVSNDGRGTQFTGVRYKNLRTGTYQYVSPR